MNDDTADVTEINLITPNYRLCFGSPFISLETLYMGRAFLGDHFVKRFAICYRTVVCVSVCLVTLVYCVQTVRWIKMLLSTEIGLSASYR